MSSGQRYATAYIPIKVGDVHCYGLVDSGASVSLCSVSLLPASHKVLPASEITIRGVSGATLKVLGSCYISLKIGTFCENVQIYVVEEMADSVFILGRDILETQECVLDFKTMSFSIKNENIPLLKAATTKNLNRSFSLHCSKTRILPAYSSTVISCHLRKNNMSKVYLSLTGAAEITEKFSKQASACDALLNTAQGKTSMYVFNPTDHPVHIYRNKKIAKFSTFHPVEINSLNVRAVPNKSENIIHTDNGSSNYGNLPHQSDISPGQPQLEKPGSYYTSYRIPDFEHLTKVSEPEALPKCDRWKNNLSELFKTLKLDELSHLTPTELDQVKLLVGDFRDIFAEGEDDLSCTDIAEMEIHLRDYEPIHSKYYNIPLALRPQAEKEIKRLMDLKIIEPSQSPYHSPSFAVLKSGPNGGIRILTDYRKLNAKIIRSRQTVPGIQEMIVLWDKCKFFSKFDFAKGFYQTPLKESSRPYTATSIPGIAFFQYCRAPLGLSSSPGFYQSITEQTMMGLKQDACVVYADDILSGSKTFEEMLQNLRLIFERIRASKMILNSKKCSLFQKSLKFLGYILHENGISPCPEKVASIQNMARPKNLRGLRSFLGLANFYRRFLRSHSAICEPLTQLTKKGAKFEWTDKCNEAWLKIKHMLANSPVLAHADFNKEFTLITDASSFAVGGILTQKGDDGILHPICYGSTVLSEAQRKWSTVQRELYSLVFFCEKYQHFLINTHFQVITDNKALLHLENFKDIRNNRLWRWFETLQKYEFTVSYWKSKSNPSDALSRLVRTDDKLFNTLPANTDSGPQNDSNSVHEISSNTNNANPVNSTQSTKVMSKNESKIDHLSADTQYAINVASSITDTIQQSDHNPNSASIEQDQTADPHVVMPNVHVSNNTLREAQNNDANLKIVINWIKNDSKPSSPSRLQGDLYNYWNSFDRISLIDGILYRKWEQKTLEKPSYLVCVPSSLQDEVIRLCHDIPASGHLGSQKCVGRIRTAYYFPKLDLKTRLYIENCHLCLKRRRPNPKFRAPLTPFAGTEPGQIIQLDLMENLPKVNGYKAILLCVDTFTKWVECISLRDTKTEVIARAFLNTWVSRQGVPSQVHSDRDGNLDTAKLIKAVYALLDITKSRNCSYRPQTDGHAERAISTVKNLLWKYCQENPTNWVNCLDQVLFAYRTSVHSTSGFSPFFLDKGRIPHLPVHVYMGTDTKSFLGKNYSEVANELYRRLQETYFFANDNIRTKQLSSKKRYDERAYVKHYDVDTWVYVWKPPPKGCDFKKMYDNFKGPFKIISKVTPHTYKIQLKPDKFDIVHFEHLKAAKTPDINTRISHYDYTEEYAEEQHDSHVSPELSRGSPNHTDGQDHSQELTVRSPTRQVIAFPALRRSTRERTQHIPYQHNPYGN